MRKTKERHEANMIKSSGCCELRMNQDIQRYQQRRYVAQVIEILLFNEMMLAPREAVEVAE
jgi:hypothetical protein